MTIPGSPGRLAEMPLECSSAIAATATAAPTRQHLCHARVARRTTGSRTRSAGTDTPSGIVSREMAGVAQSATPSTTVIKIMMTV